MPVGTFLVACLVACGQPSEVTIDMTRSLGSDAGFAKANASPQERFSGSTGHSADDGHDHSADEPQVPFDYQLPKGWVELAPGGQRWINLQPAGNPDASCYLTILPGEGGGLVANVNRWLGQLGLADLDAAGVAALPTVSLLGQPATLVEGKGHFTGMGDQDQADWGLLGLVQTMRVPGAGGEEQVFTAFIKMTGPAGLIDAERAGFQSFYQSLRARPEGSSASAGGGATIDSGTSSGDGALAFSVPAGWTDVGASGMRLASLTMGTGSECYIIRLGGDGGGLAGNVNRWRGQMGLGPLEDAELSRLPMVPCMGGMATLFDASGSYTGMSGENYAQARMLGALIFFPDVSYFVKLVGPAAEVAAEEQKFQAFLTSLEIQS